MIVLKKGRTLLSGCAIGESLRRIVIDYIVTNGGDIQTGFFPGSVCKCCMRIILNWAGLNLFQNVGNNAVKKDLWSLDGKEEITHVA
jgi:hypothetical protein